MPTWLLEIWDDVRGLAVQAGRLLRRRWYVAILLLALLAVGALMLYPYDQTIYQSTLEHRADRPALRQFALLVREWGAFIDTLTICGGLFAAGLLAGRRGWRTAALAAFVAACLAGTGVNAVRFTTGRPRPRAEMPDELYGPSMQNKMQSFPSGHAGTSAGMATALAVAMPAVGIPALISAGGVAWSSMYSRNHYATDVFVGAGLGVLIGMLLGLSARRVLQTRRPNPEP